MGNDASKKRGTSEQLTEKEIAVLKSSCNLSEAEIQETYAEFKQDCPTGKMDKKAFAKLSETFMEDKDKEAGLCDHVFAVFDKNHDGTIDFSEFVLCVAATQKNDLGTRLEFAFEMMDTSGDEQLSYDELVKFLTEGSKLAGGTDQTDNITPKDVASAIFGLFGVDEGKKLSKQQFIDGCKKNADLANVFGTG